MTCKGKPAHRKKRIKKTVPKTTGKPWAGKLCRVCSTRLIEGGNWPPSRVKRYDYICSSCKGIKKTTYSSKNKSVRHTPPSPNCPKCGTNLVKRYSPKYSKYFWGCPRFPNCRGGKSV